MKDNETIVILSDYEEEWYCKVCTCGSCKEQFMVEEEEVKVCPYCSKRIIGFADGKVTTFEFAESKREEERL